MYYSEEEAADFIERNKIGALLCADKIEDFAKLLQSNSKWINTRSHAFSTSYSQKWTALHYLAHANLLDLADIDTPLDNEERDRDIEEITPLHLAIKRENIEMVAKLLEHGASVKGSCPVLYECNCCNSTRCDVYRPTVDLVQKGSEIHLLLTAPRRRETLQELCEKQINKLFRMNQMKVTPEEAIKILPPHLAVRFSALVAAREEIVYQPKFIDIKHIKRQILPNTQFIKIEQLRKALDKSLPVLEFLNRKEIEKYLCPEDFASVFGSYKDQFLKKKKWQQETLKKQLRWF